VLPCFFAASVIQSANLALDKTCSAYEDACVRAGACLRLLVCMRMTDCLWVCVAYSSSLSGELVGMELSEDFTKEAML